MKHLFAPLIIFACMLLAAPALASPSDPEAISQHVDVGQVVTAAGMLVTERAALEQSDTGTVPAPGLVNHNSAVVFETRSVRRTDYDCERVGRDAVLQPLSSCTISITKSLTHIDLQRRPCKATTLA